MTEDEFIAILKDLAVGGDATRKNDMIKIYRSFIDIYLKPWSQTLTTNYPEILFQKLSDDSDKAYYDRHNNIIVLNANNIINAVVKCQSNGLSYEENARIILKYIIADFGYIMHEWRHFLQMEIDNIVKLNGKIEKNDIVSFKETKVIIDYFKDKIKLEKYQNENVILKELEFIKSSEYGKRLNLKNVDLNELANLYKSIQYFERAIEQDARQASINGLFKLMEQFKNDDRFADEAGKIVISIFGDVHKQFMQEEDHIKQGYPHLKDLNKWFKETKSEDFKNYGENVQNLITKLQLSTDVDISQLEIVANKKLVLEQVLASYIDKFLSEMKDVNKIAYLKVLYDAFFLNGSPWAVQIIRDYVETRFDKNVSGTEYFKAENAENILADRLKNKQDITTRMIGEISFNKTFPFNTFVENGQTRFAGAMVYDASQKTNNQEYLAYMFGSIFSRCDQLKEQFSQGKMVFDDAYDLLVLLENIRICYGLPYSQMLNDYIPQSAEELQYSVIVDELEKLCYKYVEKERAKNNLPMHSVDGFRYGSFADKKQYLMSPEKAKERILNIYGKYESALDDIEEKIIKSINQPH